MSENASKALLMAAGVLIAILIIALIYIFINSISGLSQQDEEKLKAQQTATFNKEYESYDKSLLRGTDLITLINKAIANNEQYENEYEIYDVNIAFTLKSAVTEVEVTIRNNKQVGKEKTTLIFESDEKIELKDNKAKDRINDDIRSFMRLGVNETKDSYQIVYEKDEDGQDDPENYTKKYNAYTSFKRKIFKCTKVEYSDETGRVNYMEFEEVETKNLDGYN